MYLNSNSGLKAAAILLASQGFSLIHIIGIDCLLDEIPKQHFKVNLNYLDI